MHPDPVIFIHIPKAAGRTIRSIVTRQYAPGEILPIEGQLGEPHIPPLEDTRRARMVIGLVHYGFHQQLPSPSTYLTLLREPVSRVLSLYRYIIANQRHHLHEWVASKGLIGFVSSDVDTHEVENGQTRQIAGITERSSLDPSSLARAKQHLEESFTAVGLVERFDESIMLFKRRLGWRLPFYVRKNVTGTPATRATDEALEIIRSRNTLDIQLYEFGRDLFDREMRREGPSFQMEVTMFRALNAAAQAYWATRRWTRPTARPRTD
jgi:hypothetical protein